MLFVDPARQELNMTYHFDAVGVGLYLIHYRLSALKEGFTRWDSAFR